MAEHVVTHQPAISFSISFQHPFNRAGGRTSNVLPKKSNMKEILQCLFTLSLLTLVPLNGENAKADDDSWMPGWELRSDYSLKDPFDPKELRRLVENPSDDDRPSEDDSRLMVLILRAGIEKDKSFQDLLKKPKLREARNVALALSAYDYMLNRSEAALDYILAQLATEEMGADSDVIVVLQTLDEWDRSIRAFRKHFIHTDGAGGDCMRGFKTTRAYLFPKKYAEMREAIEAPVVWTGPLLPKK
jgi:hypothetical protein